jgi:hypothetical protein
VYPRLDFTSATRAVARTTTSIREIPCALVLSSVAAHRLIGHCPCRHLREAATRDDELEPAGRRTRAGRTYAHPGPAGGRARVRGQSMAWPAQMERRCAWPLLPGARTPAGRPGARMDLRLVRT